MVLKHTYINLRPVRKWFLFAAPALASTLDFRSFSVSSDFDSALYKVPLYFVSYCMYYVHLKNSNRLRVFRARL